MIIVQQLSFDKHYTTPYHAQKHAHGHLNLESLCILSNISASYEPAKGQCRVLELPVKPSPKPQSPKASHPRHLKT